MTTLVERRRWVAGAVFDRYLEGDRLLGTVMEESPKSWFWHCYSPETMGYEATKDKAMDKVERGCE